MSDSTSNHNLKNAKMDPREFAATVLQDCNALIKPHINSKAMLKKKTSIELLMTNNPSYKQAVSRTFYGGGKSSSKPAAGFSFTGRILNEESHFGDDDRYGSFADR